MENKGFHMKRFLILITLFIPCFVTAMDWTKPSYGAINRSTKSNPNNDELSDKTIESLVAQIHIEAHKKSMEIKSFSWENAERKKQCCLFKYLCCCFES